MGCFGVVWGVTTDPADSDDCAFASATWFPSHQVQKGQSGGQMSQFHF